jgi:threonyl-tRNA synthetase
MQQQQHPYAAMRHSCAHLLGAAVLDLWPDARFGVGPAIEHGFYYDVELPAPIDENDLARIEARMRDLQARDQPFVHERWPVDDALRWMRQHGQVYKVELIELLRQRGATTVSAEIGDDVGDAAEEVSIYRLGDFVDLCKGPHVAHAGEIGPFRLTSISGAYWRGDSRRPQLTRIYGLCFGSQEELEHRAWQMEQARLRDHRRLGRELGFFAASDEVGSGLPLWLPEGTVVRLELEKLAREEEGREGYRPIATPVIAKESLYLRSGHLPYYREEMYAPIEIDGERFYLRPMCCPHHHQVFAARPRSYRDLPLRLSEYGQVFRYEASGALSGLMRTRGFCQNDAHIYCRADQVQQEFVQVMRLHARYYDLLGIDDYVMRFSLPDLASGSKYVQDPAAWQRAIDIVRAAMVASGLPYVEAPGEAAFYGPKIDFMIRSAVGQEYAISTNQLDFVASGRFDLAYTGEDGARRPVYVIHRAPLGSHERFVAFLLEHFAGALPVWLAPLQARMVPISTRHEAYARAVADRIRHAGAATFDGLLRVDVDDTQERMQKKILRGQQAKIPYLAVVGDREAADDTLSVRRRDGVSTPGVPVDAFIGMLRDAVATRARALA